MTLVTGQRLEERVRSEKIRLQILGRSVGLTEWNGGDLKVIVKY